MSELCRFTDAVFNPSSIRYALIFDIKVRHIEQLFFWRRSMTRLFFFNPTQVDPASPMGSNQVLCSLK